MSVTTPPRRLTGSGESITDQPTGPRGAPGRRRIPPLNSARGAPLGLPGVVPYYLVCSLIYIAVAIMVIYGLSAHYGEQAA
jgi:hypothetical protein